MATISLGGKSGVGDVFPAGAIEKSWGDLEPLITPAVLKARFLFGIPLVSNMKDPRTGKGQVMDDEAVKDQIARAIKRVELESRMDINPIVRLEKYPFDRNEYEAFGYFRLLHRPVTNIIQLAVVPSNNIDVYIAPLEWVETGMLAMGQINIVPLNIAIGNGGFIPTQSAGGAVFLSILAQSSWIPAFWQINYVSGFPDNLMPMIVNELIGVSASIQILRDLAATYARSTSHGLGIDALSQSISTPGPAIFDNRLATLEDDKKKIISQLRAVLGTNLFSGNV